MECSEFNAHSLYIECQNIQHIRKRGTEVHKECAIHTIVEKISIAKQIHPKITKYQKHENKKQTLFKHY